VVTILTSPTVAEGIVNETALWLKPAVPGATDRAKGRATSQPQQGRE